MERGEHGVCVLGRHDAFQMERDFQAVCQRDDGRSQCGDCVHEREAERVVISAQHEQAERGRNRRQRQPGDGFLYVRHKPSSTLLCHSLIVHPAVPLRGGTAEKLRRAFARKLAAGMRNRICGDKRTARGEGNSAGPQGGVRRRSVASACTAGNRREGESFDCML